MNLNIALILSSLNKQYFFQTTLSSERGLKNVSPEDKCWANQWVDTDETPPGV